MASLTTPKSTLNKALKNEEAGKLELYSATEYSTGVVVVVFRDPKRAKEQSKVNVSDITSKPEGEKQKKEDKENKEVEKKIEEKEDKFVCKKCNKEFKSKKWLEKHREKCK